MSDNTTLPGTGDVIADEDLGGVKYQKVKLVDGTPGSSTPAKVTAGGQQSVSVDDLAVALIKALGKGLDSMAIDPTTGRLRITLDNIAAALTLATITTVGTVSTVTKASQLGSLGIDASGAVYDLMDATRAQCVRGRIS